MDKFVFAFLKNTSLGSDAYCATAYSDDGVFTLLADGINSSAGHGIFVNENNEICVRNNPSWYSSYPNYRVLVVGY